MNQLDTKQPLPQNVRQWLATKGFQIIHTRATRPWPGKPDYWIEASVTGDQSSPVTFIRGTNSVAHKHRHQQYCGTAIEVKSESTDQELENAYKYFLIFNETAAAGFSGIQKFPTEQPLHGKPPTPAVK